MTESGVPESHLGPAAAGELQSLVDTLSLALGRSVVLDDPALVPIAFSRQWGDIDRVRSDAILERGTSSRVRDALFGQGIGASLGVMRTSGSEALGMASRLCMPVRNDGIILGFFWVVDPDASLDDGKSLGRITDAARYAAELLIGRPDPPLERETELVAALCSPVAADRNWAAVEVSARGLLSDRSLIAVRVASTRGMSLRLGDLARRLTHRVSAGHALVGRVSGGLLAVLHPDEPVLSVLDPELLARWVFDAADGRVAVGQSAVMPGLRDLPEARRQAELALRVASASSRHEPHAAWGALRADRLISQLPTTAMSDIPWGLAQLLSGEPELARTLAVFLESAGDVKRASAALALHRTGLYYRLRRIEELTGLRLANGDDRLLAHLALRLAGTSSTSV
jgi:hypothetical protein